MLAQNGWEQSGHPVVTTAAAPDYSQYPEPFEQPARGRFETVAANPAVTRRLPPKQKALFAYRDNQKVVEMETYATPSRTDGHARTKDSLAGETRKAARRSRVPANQETFDFYATAPARPSQPFTRELDRSQLPLAVAPLGLRAMATAFDLGLAAALTLVFLVAVRLWLGYLPLGAAMMFYAPIPVLIGIAYKLAFALNGQATLGVQALHLRVVSFDGQRPTIMQRIVRVFMGILSFVAAGLGLLWAVTDEESLTWHDMVTQTFLAMEPGSQFEEYGGV